MAASSIARCAGDLADGQIGQRPRARQLERPPARHARGLLRSRPTPRSRPLALVLLRLASSLSRLP